MNELSHINAASQSTPSRQDKISEDLERWLRYEGAEIIQMATIYLNLPQVVAATAQVLLQRFYHMSSFAKYGSLKIAMAAIFLASKVEEKPQRLRMIIQVAEYIRQRRRNLPISEMKLFSEQYHNIRKGLVNAELQILRKLGFHVHVRHPHSFLISFLRHMGLSGNKVLVQRSWAYLNDSYRTDVVLHHTPNQIAATMISLACESLQVGLSTVPPWHEFFDVSKQDIDKIRDAMAWMYVKEPPQFTPHTCSELEDYISAPERYVKETLEYADLKRRK